MKHVILKAGAMLVLFLVVAGCFPIFVANAAPDTMVVAQGEGGEAAAAAPASPANANGRSNLLIISAFSAAFAIAIAAACTGIGQGNAVAKAMEAIGRNPESQKRIFPTLILGLAFIESLALYALLISLVLLFFNPLINKL